MTAAGEEGHAQEGATAGEVYDPFGLDLDLDVVTSADLVALHRAVLAQPMGGTGIVVARATGSELVDPDGTGYLDCLSGLGDARFGHRHPRLLAAARRQLDRSGLLAPAVSDEQTGRFARDFAALVGQRRVAVVESGSAARALAESLARAWVGAGRGVSAASVVVGSVVGDRMPSQTPDVLVVEAVDPTTVRICDGAQVAALASSMARRWGAGWSGSARLQGARTFSVREPRSASGTGSRTGSWTGSGTGSRTPSPARWRTRRSPCSAQVSTSDGRPRWGAS